jgi:hypothetical protein
VHKTDSIGGRPKLVAEYVEGKQASTNFVGAMRRILSTPKPIDHRHGESVKPRKSK